MFRTRFWAFSKIPALDEKGLLESLEIYGREQLYQKAGYILESYKGELKKLVDKGTTQRM